MADDKLIIPVGFNFNIEEIDKEWQAKKAEIEKALKAEISLTFKMPSTKSLDNLESVVNRLKDLKIEPITPETKDAISSLTRELTTLQKILERIQALNIKSAKDVAATALAEEKITTQRAIAAKNLAQQRSNNALAVTRENKALLQQKTLEDQAALVKLRVQKAEESLTNARNRSLGAIKSQNSALFTQKGILNGMPQFLNQYLSILGAWRLVDNIRKTTADFELQRISLQAMIQDKEKADKLFGQTLELAIESPFTAQELLSYTKQLSAYRIETDKLFDTTKRLADVSAGLGVDMSQLILAYGQVRAASVLRGQEVRQFTEAGIPLIQLLADKFTLLKNRVVDTSEVFDLISKRQVPFEMVADIFEDMTNKGGIFYDMQQKQANTLYGIYQKLTDNIQQAFYRVGDSQLGALKAAGHLLVSMSKNLETILSVGTNLVGIWAAGKVAAVAYGSAVYGAEAATAKSILTDKKKAAAQLIQASNYRLLTTEELRLIATTNRLTAAEIAQMGVNNPAARELALRLLALGKLNKAEGLRLAQLGMMTKAEVLYAAATTKTQRVVLLFSSTIGKLVVNLKALWASLINNPLTIAFAGLAAVISAFRALNKHTDMYKDANEKMTQSAKESLSAFKEEYSTIQRIYKDQLSGLDQNSDKHREINERLTEMLSRNEEIAKLIKQRVVGISDEADRMRELVRLADLYQETLSITASNPTLFSGALQASGPGWMQNIDKLASKYKSNMSSISSELGRLLADGVHNENVLLNNLRKDMDAMERSGASYAERIQVLLSYFKDLQKYQSSGIFDFKTLNQNIGNTVRVFQNASDAADRFWYRIQSQYKEFRRQVIDWSDLKTFGLKPEDAKDFQELLRSFAKKGVEAMREEFKGAGPEMNEILLNVFGLTDISRVLSKGEEELKGWRKRFADALGSAIKPNTRYDEGVDGLIKQYKTAKETYDNLSNAVNAGQKEFTKDLTESEKVLKLLRDIAKEYGIELDKKQATKTIKDRTQALEGEVKVLKEAYSRYQSLKKVRGDALAASDVEKLYGDLAKNFNFLTPSLALTPEELVAQLKKAAEYAQKQLNDKNAALKFNMDVSDTSYNALKEGIEKDLKRLANDISLQNEAKKMYESILAATGDMNFAAQITTSTTGLDTLDVFSKLREQLKKTLTAYQTKSGGIIDWDTLFATDEAGNKTVLDIKKVQAAIKELPETVQTSAKSAMNAYFNYEQETVKKMAESVQKFGDYEKRRNIIAAKAAEERARIESSTILTPDQKTQGVEAVNKSERRQIAGVNLDEIKNLEMFAQAFGNLDRVGTKTLGNLTSMMKNFYEASKNDLDPTQLREVVRIIQNLEEQSWERSPFAAIKEGINDILTGTREVQAAEANLAAARAAQAEVEKRNASEIAILRLQMSQAGTDEERATILQRINDLERQNRDAVKNTQQAVEDLAAAEYKVQTGFTKTRVALSRMDKFLGQVSAGIGEVNNAIGVFSDVFGGAFGKEASAAIQDIQKGFQVLQAGIALVNVVLAITDATAKTLMTTMLPLLAAAAVLGGILAIFSAQQRRIKEEQEASERAVRKLENAYKDLERAMDRAYSTSDINKVAREQTQNLLRQQEELRKQIRLEYQKKDKDFDQGRVDDMERQIEEIGQQIADNRRELVESFYGTDFKTFSSDLAQAIYDGVKDGSLSAKEAWNETVDEMVDKMILELATAKFIMPGVERILDSFMEETRRLNGLSEDELPTLEQFPFEDLREALKAYLGEFWGDFEQYLPSGGESNLTGISKAVGSLTEDTALVLAAAANSMIYYQVAQYDQVVSINAILTGWNELIMGTEETAGLIPTLMASQTESMELLRGIKSDTGRIATATEQMADDIGSVVAPLGSKVGAKAINVNS